MSEDEKSSAVERANEAIEALEKILKDSEVGAELADAGVNVSLALTAVAGVRSYIAGEKLVAAEDFETVAEEIRARVGMNVGGLH